MSGGLQTAQKQTFHGFLVDVGNTHEMLPNLHEWVE
jgi:hypothetical protein